MTATHHPATTTTPQGKAIHPPRLAKIAHQTAKNTSVWANDALGLAKPAHETPRTPHGLPKPPHDLADKTPENVGFNGFDAQSTSHTFPHHPNWNSKV